jgi:hypothetical protein
MASNLLDYASSLAPAQAAQLQAMQKISETKYDTIQLAAAALPARTDFFQTPSADLAVKNFEGPGMLISGGKYFLLQTIGVVIAAAAAATTGANILDLINRCSLRLQVDQKIFGTFPIHQLTGFGGAYTPSQGAVTAAAAPAGALMAPGITNGIPHNQPFRILPVLVEGQKPFMASLIGPTGAAITLAGTLDLKVCLGGIQFQAIQ